MLDYSKICFRKFGDSWVVQTPVGLLLMPGMEVTVALANGSTKKVTLGKMVATNDSCRFFAKMEQPKPAAELIGEMRGILKLFDTAKLHLKHPAVTLLVDGRGLRISIAGDRAQVPGSLTLTSVEKDADGRREWFGRVRRDGQFEPSHQAPAALADVLREFSNDPVKVAQDHGRLNGICCFCNRPLSDERSTAVGYGKTCGTLRSDVGRAPAAIRGGGVMETRKGAMLQAAFAQLQIEYRGEQRHREAHDVHTVALRLSEDAAERVLWIMLDIMAGRRDEHGKRTMIENKPRRANLALVDAAKNAIALNSPDEAP